MAARTAAQIARSQRKAEKRRLQNEARIERIEPVCVECATLATEIVGGEQVYPHRPDLYPKRFFRCACGAFVGCHRGTEIPLGRPAGPATQKARRAAHAAFDPLWQAKVQREGVSKKDARGAGYAWLAEQLGIERHLCHIGFMDKTTAERVVDVIAAARTIGRAAA